MWYFSKDLREVKGERDINNFKKDVVERMFSIV